MKRAPSLGALSAKKTRLWFVVHESAEREVWVHLIDLAVNHNLLFPFDSHTRGNFLDGFECRPHLARREFLIELPLVGEILDLPSQSVQCHQNCGTLVFNQVRIGWGKDYSLCGIRLKQRIMR